MHHQHDKCSSLSLAFGEASATANTCPWQLESVIFTNDGVLQHFVSVLLVDFFPLFFFFFFFHSQQSAAKFLGRGLYSEPS